jgi:hypothetical protein
VSGALVAALYAPIVQFGVRDFGFAVSQLARTSAARRGSSSAPPSELDRQPHRMSKGHLPGAHQRAQATGRHRRPSPPRHVHGQSRGP